MDLKYPIILVLGLILLVLFFLPFKLFKDKKENGIKIANTKKLKETPMYKKYLAFYKSVIFALRVICTVAIVISLFLLARPFSIVEDEQKEYNRDIFLCMDMSASVWELNGEVVENLKKTVNSLQGDRFGISIFNTSSVVLIPLTDDYKTVMDELDRLKEALDVGKEYFAADQRGQFTTYYYSHYSEWDYIEKQINYLTGGTLIDNANRGSSLIGDGLASCVFDFSGIDDNNNKRNRIIVFTTDNDLEGEPYISLEDAASLTHRKNIHLYGIGNNNVVDEVNMKNAIEVNGKGRYYRQTSDVNSIIDDIEKTSKTLTKRTGISREIELPKMPFIFLTIASICIVLLGKVVDK